MSIVSTEFPDKFLMYVRSDGTVHKIVKEVYRFLHIYASSEARQKWMKAGEECEQATLENEFFTDDEIKEMKKHGQEPHIVNKLVTGVQGTSAVATANRPDIKVFPLRESDPYLAELAKSGLEHVWLKNYGNDVVADFTERRNIRGVGAAYGQLDKDKGPFGAVVFEEEDPTIWYWDANSRKRDRSDTHLIKAQLRSYRYIRDNYPELKEDQIIAVNDTFEDSPTELPNTITDGDNYQENEKDGVPAADDRKRMVWEIEAYMLRTEQEHWGVVVMPDSTTFVIQIEGAGNKKDAEATIAEIQANGIDLDGSGQLAPVQSIVYWPRKMRNRYMSLVVGTELIKQSPDGGDEVDEVLNPLGVDSDGDPVLPVVFYYAQRGAKAYYHSPTFYALPSNKSLCKRETQYTLAVSKLLSAPIVREEGVRWKDPERPDIPGNELIMSKSNRKPERLAAPVIDLSALTARIVEDKANIDEAYGLPEVLRGKVPENLERMSGRLGLALQDTGTIMQNPAIRGLESCLERLGKLLLSLMLKSWNEQQWRSLVTEERVNDFRPMEEEGGTPDSDKTDGLLAQEKEERRAKWEHAIQKITREGISIVDFNVAITAGSSLPTNRLLKEETALEKYKVGLYDRRAALEYSGDPHAKEIASRMDAREMQMAQMGARPKKG